MLKRFHNFSNGTHALKSILSVASTISVVTKLRGRAGDICLRLITFSCAEEEGIAELT